MILRVFFLLALGLCDDNTVDTNVERLGEYYAPSSKFFCREMIFKLFLVFLPIFVRNKAHALPYFLAGIENLAYPKSRIRVWFVTDHNEDDSLEMLKVKRF